MAALSGLLPISAHAALPGAELSLCWAIPFAGILLSIALGPLLFAHFWHKNYGKVALMWAVLAAVPLFMFFGTQTSVEALAHALIGDYVPFIIFVGSLYIVAGGIHLRGSFVGKLGLILLFFKRRYLGQPYGYHGRRYAFDSSSAEREQKTSLSDAYLHFLHLHCR